MQLKIHLNIQKTKSCIYIIYILLLLQIFWVLSFQRFPSLSNFQNKILKDTCSCSPIYNSYLYSISHFFFSVIKHSIMIYGGRKKLSNIYQKAYQPLTKKKSGKLVLLPKTLRSPITNPRVQLY